MSNIDGTIISGDIYPDTREFVITKVKSFETESLLNLEQINAIYDYLSKAMHYDDYHIININDQIPVKLTNDEIKLILNDFDKVKQVLK